MRVIHQAIAATSAATCVFLLLVAGDTQAAITTTNLFAHQDAALDVYKNAAKGSSLTPDPSLNGELVVEWWDQARDNVATSGIDGNQIVQSGAGPLYKTNAINGLPSILWQGNTGSTSTTAPYGGLTGISNSGGTDSFGTDLNTNNISYIIVFKQNVDPADNRWLFMVDLHSTGGNENTLGVRFKAGNRETWVLDGSGTEQIISHSAAGTADQWMVISVVWDGDAGTLTEYINGQLSGSLNTATNGNAMNAIRFRYGADRGNGASTRFNGEIAEGLLYNATLSDADRIASEQALLTKYAIPEPASLGLLLGGAILMLNRRRGANHEAAGVAG
ncbi:MAG: PEP-CTERM sorting domain-containing protein [Phycisphaeraceae bacterium]|nr:PEP-CTERM sorting domain-containing protein [Phycisphaeraceae bacterium]